MARNIREMMLVLDGKMGAGLKNATAETSKRLTDVSSRFRQLSAAKVSAGQFSDLQTKVGNTRAAFIAAQQEIERLRQEMKATKKPSDDLVANFENARLRSGSLKTELSSQERELRKLERTMRVAGFSSADLAADTRVLDGQMEIAGREADTLRKHLARLQIQEKSANDARQRSGSMVGNATRSLLGLAAAYVGVQTATSIIVGTGEYEQASIAFETMLRSATKAKKLMGDLYAFAGQTPFEFPEIQQSAKSLLAFGVAQQLVTNKLRMLGDIASGTGVPLTDIAEIYGKAKVSGRLFAEDINQLTGRGIPIIAELAKQFHVSESKVRGLVEKGKVGFKDLDRAMMSLTTGQGRFTNMTEKQSHSLLGLWSTFKDGIRMAFIDETNEALPNLKKLLGYGIDNMPKLVEWLDKIAKGVSRFGKGAAQAYGWYQDNLSGLTPVILGVAGALVVLEGVSRAVAIAQGIATTAILIYRGELDKMTVSAKVYRGAMIAMKWVATNSWDAAKLVAYHAKLLLCKAALLAWNGVQKVAAALQWAWNAALNANPIGLIVIGIAALAAGVYLLYKNWDKVKSIALIAWGWIKKHTLLFAPILGLAYPILLIAKNWDKVKNGAKVAWQVVATGASTAWDWVAKLTSSVKDGLVAAWNKTAKAAKWLWGWVEKIASYSSTGITIKLVMSFLKEARDWWNARQQSLTASRNADASDRIARQYVKSGSGTIRSKLEARQAEVQRHAMGGIVTKPTLSWVGEAGSEAIIPLSGHRSRARGLWGLAGRELGIEDSAVSPNPNVWRDLKKSIATVAGTVINVTFAPHIAVSSNATRREVQEGVGASFEEFKRLMDRYERDKKRTSFA